MDLPTGVIQTLLLIELLINESLFSHIQEKFAMEIVVSVFATLVAGGCLLAVVKSDLQANRKVAKQNAEANDS